VWPAGESPANWQKRGRGAIGPRASRGRRRTSLRCTEPLEVFIGGHFLRALGRRSRPVRVAVEYQSVYRKDQQRQVLVLYLKRPRAKSWALRRCVGALQIQRLEGSRPGDYGICIGMSRFRSFASLPLLSERFGFSNGSQRECPWGGALESLERTTILHSEERERQKQCARRSTSETRGWRCGFMRRSG